MNSGGLKMDQSNLFHDVKKTPVVDTTLPNFTLHKANSFPKPEIAIVPRMKIIDITSLATNEDLAMLKEQDPFLYYSIPCIRNAEMKLHAVDISCLKKNSVVGQKRSISCPSRIQYQAVEESKIVSRKTCLSFEYHVDKLLSDYYLTNEDEVNDVFDVNCVKDMDMFFDRFDDSD
ncbi:hypothetical protein ACHAXS_004850 [Conticribra weissflogii]